MQWKFHLYNAAMRHKKECFLLIDAAYQNVLAVLCCLMYWKVVVLDIWLRLLCVTVYSIAIRQNSQYFIYLCIYESRL